MKTIGMIGGVSWESTAIYYRLVNSLVRQQLGGAANAKSLLLTLSFPEVAAMQEAGDWTGIARLLEDGARRLQLAGADCLVLCSNTMHVAAPEVERAITLPLIHIVDVTAAAVRQQGLQRVGLLGTRYTMEQDFYRDRLRLSGIEAIIPDERDRAEVHRVIFEELAQGRVLETSRQSYLAIIERLQDAGAQGVILGCTEIPMLITSEDTLLLTFDTTYLHAAAAVHWALQPA